MSALPQSLIEELHSVCDFNPETEAEVVQAFVACGWMNASDGIANLPPTLAHRFIEDPNAVVAEARALTAKQRPARDAEARKLEQARLNTLRKEKAVQRGLDTIPPEFANASIEQAPRPRQFKFVTGHWLNEFDDDEFDESDALIPKEPTTKGLILTGEPGTGKTACLWATYRECVMFDWNADSYVITSSKFSMTCKAKSQTGETRAEFTTMFTAMMRAEYLYIDDVGTEKLSESGEEVLYELINHRNSERLHTLLTTNCGLRQLASKFSPDNRSKMARRFAMPFYALVDFDKP